MEQESAYADGICSGVSAARGGLLYLCQPVNLYILNDEHPYADSDSCLLEEAGSGN
jgi:hypothetical protein